MGKVANPQDILIFSKSSKKVGKEAKFDDSERLRPEELNQQNIEALVAESNLKMEVLPVSDLDVALHNFVNKDEKMAFYSCVQYNLEETRSKIAQDSDAMKFEEDDIILKVGECLEERVRQRTANKDDQPFSFSGQSLEDIRGKITRLGSAVSFSDDEDATMPSASKSTAGKGRKDSSQSFRTSREASEVGKISSRGRGRGRGRGRASNSLKQTTLDASLGFRQSQRSASIAASASVRSIAEDDENVESPSIDEDVKQDTTVIEESSDDDKTVQGKGRKRAAPRGRGKASATAAKRGRKSDSSSSSLQRMLMDVNEDDDDDDMRKKENRPRPRVTRNYGALRR